MKAITAILLSFLLVGCMNESQLLPEPPEYREELQLPANETSDGQPSPVNSPVPAPEPSPKTSQPDGIIIEHQEDVIFELYFPNTGSLKSDESEILIYNKKNVPVKILTADMKFLVDNTIYEQYSGTWEKFPGITSWDRIDYVNIKPDYYKGELLMLDPGQKGKLHWHYKYGNLRGKQQAVEIDVTYTIGTHSYTLKKRVNRESYPENPTEQDEMHE